MKNHFHITLVGMSGSGKSTLSMGMEEYGFRRFCCDEMIRRKLLERSADFAKSGEPMGNWLGFPWDPGFEEKERIYLELETETLLIISAQIESMPNRPVVIDTTGSFIYAANHAIEQIKEKTRVVHLETPLSAYRRMQERYLKNRRPVIWNRMFKPLPGETEDDALKRCYIELISSREKIYKGMSDLTVGYARRNARAYTVPDFLSDIGCFQK